MIFSFKERKSLGPNWLSPWNSSKLIVVNGATLICKGEMLKGYEIIGRERTSLTVILQYKEEMSLINYIKITSKMDY